jgi:hypothetical protein
MSATSSAKINATEIQSRVAAADWPNSYKEQRQMGAYASAAVSSSHNRSRSIDSVLIFNLLPKPNESWSVCFSGLDTFVTETVFSSCHDFKGDSPRIFSLALVKGIPFELKVRHSLFLFGRNEHGMTASGTVQKAAMTEAMNTRKLQWSCKLTLMRASCSQKMRTYQKSKIPGNTNNVQEVGVRAR